MCSESTKIPEVTLEKSIGIFRNTNDLKVLKIIGYKLNVELCPENTVLQGFALRNKGLEFEYLKKCSQVNIEDKKVKFHDTAEHIGVIQAVTGYLPHVIHRISAHKKAIGAVLQNGLAKSHRAKHAARLKVEQIYGASVLLSGLSMRLPCLPLPTRNSTKTVTPLPQDTTVRDFLSLWQSSW